MRDVEITPTSNALLRLITWLSPAFPVGSFSYSHGLEEAVQAGLVHDADTLADWLEGLIDFGGGWNDAVLLAAAHGASPQALIEIADLARALCPSAERLRETVSQGAAFIEAVQAGWPSLALAPTPYPVAVGAAAGASGLPLHHTLIAYLHAFVGNLVGVAQRLMPLGQRAGVAVLARLEPAILATAARAAVSTLDDLGSAALRSDIASLRHEAMETRLFIS